MIKADVYTVETTYTYNDAESVTDTLTYTIKKEVYEAKAQISEIEYNGSEQTLGVDFSQLPAGVKIKAGSPVEVKGKNVGTYTATIQMDGGDAYEDFEVKVSLAVKQAIILSITLNNKETEYDGNAHAVVIEEVLPDEVQVTYVYSKDGTPIQGEPTETGVYTVVPTIVTGDNYTYTGEIPSATLTIKKAKIEGLTLPTTPIVYDGQPKSLVVEGTVPAGVDLIYTYTDKDGNPITGLPTNAGIYNVTVTVENKNYALVPVTATFEITKAKIEGLTLSRGEFDYAGVPHPLKIKEALPSGATVVYGYYENGQDIGTNAPIDAGNYIVKAFVDRGSNYEPLTLEAELKINQVVPAVDPNEMEVVYTGEAITIELAKELSYEANIEYVNNVHTDAGTYQGKAIITGGRNYKDIEVDLTLVITKVRIEGLTLPTTPIVYDGQPKSLVVEGTVPAGVDLIYTYTDKDGNPIADKPTDAGTYNVTVTVEDKNYVLVPISTTFEITKATLTIAPVSKSAVYSGQSQNIEITEALPSGVVVEKYESNTGVDVGKYEGKAIINGGNNYNDTTVELTLDITPFEIKGLTLPSSPVVYDGQPKSVIAEGPVPTGVKLKYTYTDKDGNPIQGAPTDAGIYNVTVTVEDKNYNLEPISTTFEVTKATLAIGSVSKSAVYSGQSQNIEITETLPAGVVVEKYESNTGVDVGKYEGKAIINGGNNYNDTTVELTLDITPFEIKGLTLPSSPVVYDGQPKSVIAEGPVPAEVDLKYTYTDKDGNPIQGAPTDAGIYNVTVTVEDKNYNLEPISTTFEVTKATLEGKLEGKTVTYNGNPQEVKVEGVPTDLVVEYTYKDKDGNPIQGAPTDAGEYTVEAIVKGGANYEDKKFKAKVTISKAVIPNGTLEGKTVTYNGNPQEVKVEGVSSDFEVTYVYSKDGNPIQGAPTEAGDYTVEAIVKGGANYEDKKFEAKVTISKAVILNGTLEGKTVTYNGNPQEVKVEGVPTDLVVEYTYKDKDGNPIQGAPIDAGEYTVEAIVKGGTNYEDKKFEAKVTISKAVIPNGTLEGKTVTYNGNPQEVKVEGVPTDLVVEYTYKDKDGNPIQGKPIEAGDYTVEAIVRGGTNYEDKKFTTTVKIAKAAISGVTFNGKEITYNGLTQRIEIVGELPKEASVSYESNEGVNAGEYLAKAIIKGGKNYEDLVLTTTLKINKANITGVSFIDKVVAYNKAEQIIEITGALPTGVTVVYEKAKQTEVGIYEAVARIVGGTNYNDLRLTARFEIKEDRTPSKDAEIFELVINGVVYKKPSQIIEHTLRPTPYEDITDIDIVSFTEYSSLNVPEVFTVDTRDPKVYYKDITVTSEDGKTSKTYTLKLIKPIEDRLIILQKFQNTLLINNNPSTNGGYTFVSYQWFRNGVVVGTKQSYSVGQAGRDKLNPNDYYYLIVKTTTGEEIYSTRIDIYEEQSKEIKLYPNPVSSSDMTTNIMVDYSAAQFGKGRVEILTPDGRFIYRQELTIGENRVVIPTQLSAGIYLAVVDINGKKQTIRFSVK